MIREVMTAKFIISINFKTRKMAVKKKDRLTIKLIFLSKKMLNVKKIKTAISSIPPRIENMLEGEINKKNTSKIINNKIGTKDFLSNSRCPLFKTIFADSIQFYAFYKKALDLP